MPTATRIYYQEILHSVFLYMLSSRLNCAEIEAIAQSALARACASSKNPLEKKRRQGLAGDRRAFFTDGLGIPDT